MAVWPAVEPGHPGFGGQATANSDVYPETVIRKESRLSPSLLKTSSIQNVNRKLQYIL